MISRTRRSKRLKWLFFSAILTVVVIWLNPLHLLGKLQLFPVNNVLFHSDRFLKLSDVEAACGTIKGKDIFELPLNKLKNCIKSIGWSKEVSVSRRLPSSMVIHVHEFSPIALAWIHRQWHFLGEGGRVLAPVSEAEFLRYPLIPQYDALTDALQKDAVHIAQSIGLWSSRKGLGASDIVWDARKGWSLFLSRGATIRLGSPVSSANLERFQLLLEQHEKSVLESQLIDLRVEKKIIVKGQKQS